MSLNSIPIGMMSEVVAPPLALQKFSGQGTREELEKASKDFEAVFMAQMLKPMWAGMETDPMFGGGPGEDAFRDLLVQEYGKSMTSVDNYGLSNAVMDELLRLQSNVSEG